MDTIQDILRDAAALGLKLYTEKGLLRGRPSSVATPELRARIEALKPALILHLRSAPPPPRGQPVSGTPFENERQRQRAAGMRSASAATTSASSPAAPARPDAKDRAVFAAWDRVVGYAPFTAKDLLRGAARYPNFESALTAVSGNRASGLDEYLTSLSGVEVDGHQIVIDRTRRGETVWRMASTWSIAIAMRVSGQPSVERVEGIE